MTFPNPSSEQYQAMLELKKQGATEILVRFDGSGDNGVYDAVECDGSPLPETLSIVEKYIESVLDSEWNVNFNNEGCRGYFVIKLTEEEPVANLEVEAPVWETQVDKTETLTPETQLEFLVAHTNVL